MLLVFARHLQRPFGAFHRLLRHRQIAALGRHRHPVGDDVGDQRQAGAFRRLRVRQIGFERRPRQAGVFAEQIQLKGADAGLRFVTLADGGGIAVAGQRTPATASAVALIVGNSAARCSPYSARAEAILAIASRRSRLLLSPHRHHLAQPGVLHIVAPGDVRVAQRLLAGGLALRQVGGHRRAGRW